MPEQAPWCCWYDGEQPCDAGAEFDVWDEDPSEPYSGTQVCGKHLADACRSNGSHHRVSLIEASRPIEAVVV